MIKLKGRADKAKAKHAIVESPVMQGGMARALGVRLVSLTKKKVVAEMSITSMHMNRSDRVSGGAIMAFADVVGAAGAVFNLPPGHRSGTIESKSNFFAAGKGPTLKAVSIPLHFGRTIEFQRTIFAPREVQIPQRVLRAPSPLNGEKAGMRGRSC